LSSTRGFRSSLASERRPQERPHVLDPHQRELLRLDDREQLDDFLAELRERVGLQAHLGDEPCDLRAPLPSSRAERASTGADATIASSSRTSRLASAAGSQSLASISGTVFLMTAARTAAGEPMNVQTPSALLRRPGGARAKPGPPRAAAAHTRMRVI
jgi:hypothetical protein